MDYGNTDNYGIVNQSFSSAASALIPPFEGVEDVSQEEQLKVLLKTSQPEIQSNRWSVHPNNFDPFLLSCIDSGNLFNKPEPWSKPVPLGPRAHSLPFSSASTNAMELEINDNHGIDSANLAIVALEEAPLVCYEPGCDSQRIYASPSTFRKHQGKHTRPHACQSVSCSFRRFGDKAGLARHCREVHGSKVHYCPFRSCNRHTQGFARKDNLLKHQLRCHGDKPTYQQPGSSNSPLISPVEHGDEFTQLGRSHSEDIVPDSETQSVTEVYSGGEDKLERKLRDLRAKRDRINRKITTLESAQALLGLNST